MTPCFAQEISHRVYSEWLASRPAESTAATIEAAAAPAAPAGRTAEATEAFVASEKFTGARTGYYFGTGLGGHDWAIGLIWCNFGGNGGNFLDSAWKSFGLNHFGLMFAPVRSWGYWILSGHRWKPEICHEVAKKCYRSRCGWQWWRW